MSAFVFSEAILDRLFEQHRNHLKDDNVRREDTAAVIQPEVEEDWRRISAVLPDDLEIRDTLDVGCGTGTIDIVISRALPNANINLFDGTGEYRQGMYGFDDKSKPYNDMDETRKFMEANGVDAALHMADPSLTIPCDLMFSLFSWGYHYPVRTYIGLLRRSLRPGGILVIDIKHRSHSRGTQELLSMGLKHLVDIPDDVVQGKRQMFRMPQ